MNRLRITIVLVSLMLLASKPSFAQTIQSAGSSSHGLAYQHGFLYVKFKASSKIQSYFIKKDSTGYSDLNAVFAQIGVTDVQSFMPIDPANYHSKDFAADRIADIQFAESPEHTAEAAMAALKKLPEVELVSRRILFTPCFTPNDSLFSSQYALTLMNVPRAWDLTTGDTSMVLAVLDEGVNYTHEDLQGNLQYNYGEMGLDKNGHDKRTNGIDDDGDGFVDNWRGWDLASFNADQWTTKYNGDNDPMPGPGEGHGTFVAGCLGATVNNKHGVAGVGYNCHYLPLKVTADTGSTAGSISFGYEGILYAATHGARILNCSWGADASGATPDELSFFQQFIDSANARGVLIVAAAGNNHFNLDDSTFIPACLHNILSVGATDENDALASFSNYGHIVDLYAPGADIVSVDFPGTNGYTSSGGTSFASPYTVGVAGLVWSHFPQLQAHEIRLLLDATCDPVKSPNDPYLYHGRVNAYSAMTKLFPIVRGVNYTIDGVDSGALQYLNKEYTFNVTFKMMINSGTNLTARLIPIPGYTVQQASASLGSLVAGATANGSFKFTRDSTDDGTELPMEIYVTDGKSYSDTLYLVIEISGDDIYKNNTSVTETPLLQPSLTVYPNPANTSVTLSFTFAHDGSAHVTMYDMLGREVRAIDGGAFSAGAATMQLPLAAIAPGVYTIRLTNTAGEVLVSQIVVE